MLTKAIKDGVLFANLGTDEGIPAKITLEETELSKALSNRPPKGYGEYNWYKVKKDEDFLLGHAKEGIEISEDIDVFELARKSREASLKVALVYNDTDLLQVPVEQVFEICRVKSKSTNKEYSLICSVVTNIPLYPPSYIEECFVKDFNLETQTIWDRFNPDVFPYILDAEGKEQRTAILCHNLENKYVKTSDTLMGYYPQYFIQGILVTPIISYGDFSVARIDGNYSNKKSIMV